MVSATAETVSKSRYRSVPARSFSSRSLVRRHAAGNEVPGRRQMARLRILEIAARVVAGVPGFAVI